MPLGALIADPGVRSHHPASYGVSASPQLVSAARAGKALLVQVLGGTIYLGGPTVSPTNGTAYASPAVFADTTSGAAWYAYVPAGGSLFADEIY